jgi:transposase
MLNLGPTTRVFVARGATDLRRSFDRLAAMAKDVLGQDPLSGHLFCYFNRKRDRLKILVWQRGGFWLLCRRLERGTFAEVDHAEITARDLFCVLEGIDVVRERVRFERSSSG